MRAYAPSSITAVFTPAPGGDASRGVSFALEDGVSVAVTPAEGPDTSVVIDGEPTSFAPVEGVLDSLGVAARVDVRPEVPIGAGFGVSGGATLATALAATAEFDLDRTRGECLDLAHRAEVAAGTGLGDVFIQERGGLLYDFGEGRKRAECDAVVAYESYGPIPTADVLGDEEALELVREHGTRTLESFSDPPSLPTVIDRSWAFARATGLATERVGESVEAVRAAGGVATMAMLGETVVAVGAEEGQDPPEGLDHRSRVTGEGAHLL